MSDIVKKQQEEQEAREALEKFRRLDDKSKWKVLGYMTAHLDHAEWQKSKDETSVAYEFSTEFHPEDPVHV